MWNFSFDTTAIAVLQENYEAIYKQGGTITPEQLYDLKKYVWVILAGYLSPSNLVLRHWCLIDLFSNYPDHADKILKMVDTLSYKEDDNGMRVWAEGGYYFWYTMVILQLWMDKYSHLQMNSTVQIGRILDKVRKGIAETAYLRNGQWYVAPFGDVRDNPMSNDMGIDLQNIQQQPNADIAVISRIGNLGPITYKLRARPIRMNLHIPKNDYTLSVTKGVPVGFTWYTGFDNKYPNKWAEICDMLSFKRLISFFCI